jgi:2-dehydro-3-deoxyphosphooctonate aldolase (KDO 8-P synthase)
VSRIVRVGDIRIGRGHPLVLIAGPCVVEDEATVMETAGRIKQTAQQAGTPVIFKASYAKANRLRGDSYAGPGLKEGLRILSRVKVELDLPILTDVHCRQDVALCAEVADVLQIPAFLCRQTELVRAAGRTGRAVNLKKGQFLAPEDMRYLAEKVTATGNEQVLLTERGSTFGYRDLVVDMRSLVVMRDLGYPVIFDATHSIQQPSAAGDVSGGQPRFILPLVKAAVAAGCDALFVETHPRVEQALCDAACMLPLDHLEEVLRAAKEIHELVEKRSEIRDQRLEIRD